jgi:predicted adenylyl cyclase CyaB
LYRGTGPAGNGGCPLTELHRNLEIKARCLGPAAARAAVRRLVGREPEVQAQTDTYFRALNGRLKLREIEGQPAELIWYDRPDQSAARTSAYYRVPVPDAAGLKAALAAALGVRGEVRKRREITLWHNVRIHLDDVAGLGSFVEFEAVLSPSDQETVAKVRLAELCAALRVRPADQLGSSYADLLGL